MEIAVLGGMTNYQGDLKSAAFTTAGGSEAFGALFKYGLNSHFFVRGGFGLGSISASDKDNPEEYRSRNLDFNSDIQDFQLALEYRLFSPDRFRITPYIFAGLGVFHFNPYTTTFGDKGDKIFLQPLGTEGQGLPEYPEKEMYKLTQFSIPIGGGLLWHVSDRWILGVEFRQNKTFTDYLDDVSTDYALEAPLLRDRGQLAVDLAWRRDEFDGSPYPQRERNRGNPDQKDWYYFLGFNLGYRIQWDNVMGGKNNTGKGKLKQFGCPKW